MKVLTSVEESATTTSKWRGIFFDLCLIAGFIVVCYSPVLYTGYAFVATSFLTDWSTLTQPAYVFTGRSLAAGELPLWNPHWFGGYPHLAVPSNGVFYPTTVIFGFLPFYYAATTVILIHLFLFACLNYWLGRDMFQLRLPALFLAMAGAIGSLFTWHISSGHLWTLMTYSWMPLAFLAIRRVLYTGDPRWALALPPTLLIMFLAGDPQSMAFVLLWLGVFTASALILGVVTRRSSIKTAFIRGAMTLLGVLTGTALAGVVLIPSFEFMAESIRSGGVTLSYLTGLVPRTSVLVDELLRDTESYRIFPGKVTAALAIVAILGFAIPEVICLWIALAVCLVYSDMPEWLYDSVVRHVPVYNSMRGAGRVGSVNIYMFSVLSAHGLHALMRSTRGDLLCRIRWGAVTAVATILVVSSLRHDSHYFAATVLCFVGLALLAASVVNRRWSTKEVGVALFALLTIEASARLHNRYEIQPYTIFDVNPSLEAFAQQREDIDRILIVDSWNWNMNHGPAVTLLTGDRNIEGYHALFLRRYAQLFKSVAGVNLINLDEEGRLKEQGRYDRDWVTPEAIPLLDLFNVRYILRYGSEVPLLQFASENNPDEFARSQIGNLFIYRNRGALPPVYPVHEAGPVESDEFAYTLIREGSLDYRRQATLRAGTPVPPLAPPTGIEPVVLREYGPNSVVADVTMTAPGLLVMSQVWYPGWYAQVDDGPAVPTLEVNTILQATPVPAGEHRVRFFFRPRSVIVGAVVSGATAVVWLACVVAYVVWKRRRGPAATDAPAEA